MADYRQKQGSATSWRRAAQVTIHNPRNGQPTINFVEQDVVVLGNEEFHRQNAGMVAGTFDPQATFPLVSPITGQQFGTAKQEDLYVLLHSLYLHLAAKRDTGA
jgi:hypothetical protein